MDPKPLADGAARGPVDLKPRANTHISPVSTGAPRVGRQTPEESIASLRAATTWSQLTRPSAGWLQASGVVIYSARAPHTHHPGLRRLTHVSRGLLKQTRRADRAAELGRPLATLEAVLSSALVPWVRPQSLDAPNTSPPPSRPRQPTR